MASEIRIVDYSIEVAPAPIIYPYKPSNSPSLEPIAEEDAEELDDDDSHIGSCFCSSMENCFAFEAPCKPLMYYSDTTRSVQGSHLCSE
ncbi:hypothetical protein CJ030_MR2G009188 [Morella rubra]|uniref:Uncharacterized protein n=1 Tax=Morella rubra TaxID=262757 RepID=A0A6A1WF15_9ROSI|nr:hypothetical protein CJ030_MR2G009188 [Morella rubra]